MADEYINRDAVLRKMQKVATEAWKMQIEARVETIWNEAQDLVKLIPSADVRPVVRGNWEWDDDGMDCGLGSWRCSQCHTRPETAWQTMKDIVPLRWCGSKFCPNCGADMRGTNDAEQSS